MQLSPFAFLLLLCYCSTSTVTLTEARLSESEDDNNNSAPSPRKLEVIEEAPRDKVIANSYIVELKEGSAKESKQSVMLLAGSHMHFDYEHVMAGFSIQDPTDEVLQSLLSSPNVEAVYEDVMNDLYQTDPNIQIGAPWGLDRIDARSGLDTTYRYETTASDVTIYIVDSGVLQSHSEFSGRFSVCRDFVGTNCQSPGLHGTHVAGTAAGTTYGVAKGAKIADYKVCNNDGCPTSAIMAAMDEITRIGSGVANLSLGGPRSILLNNAVIRAVNAGVVVVVAAGNSGDDACKYSPASAAGVITVGSTTRSDGRSSFSNFGSCVDVFAPGSSILSSSNNGGTATLSGTSMASPHTAGTAALFLSQGANARNEIINQATPNKVSGVGSGSPNKLLFTGIDTTAFPNPSPTQPPTRFPTPPPRQPIPEEGDGEGFGCFSASSTVSVFGKGVTKMTDLTLGDRILTEQGYETIYSFAHDDDSTVADFLRLGTRGGDRVEVTGEHLLYLAGKRNPVRADSIKIGDTLRVRDSSTTGAVVTKIGSSKKAGLYAPLTPSGTIIVDNIIASCYISFFNGGDAEYVDAIGFLSHDNFAHMGLSLLRIGCSSILPNICTSYNSHGVLRLVEFGDQLTDFYSHQSILMKAMLWVTYVSVLSPFCWLEFILGSQLAGYFVFFGLGTLLGVLTLKNYRMEVKQSRKKID